MLLYGSVARGSEGPWSDIDLLVVGERGDLTAAQLYRAVRAEFPECPVSIVYLSRDRIEEYLTTGTRFLVHIREEGRVLEDPHGVVARALSAPFEPLPASDEIDRELRRLDLYDDLSRYGDNYLFCLAHIYTIAKAIVMARLAADGVYEFDRDHAFVAFARRWPDMAASVQTVQQLEPFYNMVAHRKPEPLPFPFKGHGQNVSRAVEAVRSLASGTPQLV